MKAKHQGVSRKWIGIAAAPGLAIGEAFVWRKEAVQIPRYAVEQPAHEIERLKMAREKARADIHDLRARMEKRVGARDAAIFEAHELFLEDESLVDMAEDAIRRRLNAEAAWMDAVEHFAGELAEIPDPTLAARATDVRDVGRQVLAYLLGRSTSAIPALDRPVIVVAPDLEPSETAGLDREKVLGFCMAVGGPTSHTAILAKAMGLPAVVGLGDDIVNLPAGTLLLVDGSAGGVISDPEPEELQAFQTLQTQAGRVSQQELGKAQGPAVTADGHTVEVVANIGSTSDAEIALKKGAEGVGLLRTEFLYLDRESAPTEDEQFQAYHAVLDVMGSRPVVARTLDVGGDKQLPYLDLGSEANPFLGWRAIRVCLDQPEFFKTQLRALLRASAGHNLRIMFPMISTLEEVRQARKLLQDAWRDLADRGIAVAEEIQVGMMVEIPSVAILAGRFAREVDFFSIGTNDLTQYTFAAERTNERVAHLGSAIHPAVLRQIQWVIQAGHAAGIWVGVCGELAGDEDAIPILLGLGLDEFSMSAGAIPHAKEVIRKWGVEPARSLAEKALELGTAAEVRALVRSVQPE